MEGFGAQVFLMVHAIDYKAGDGMVAPFFTGTCSL
jgi:hypothetical protein